MSLPCNSRPSCQPGCKKSCCTPYIVDYGVPGDWNGFDGATGTVITNPCFSSWDNFPKPWDACRCVECGGKPKKVEKAKKLKKEKKCSEPICLDQPKPYESTKPSKSELSPKKSKCPCAKNGSSDRSEVYTNSSSQESSDKSEASSKRGYTKRCHKCRRFDCKCLEIVPQFRARCGYISANLTKIANPTTYTQAGTTITYSYTITNTGTAPICHPINICDDKLGGWLIPQASIAPGASQTFSRDYITTAEDFANGNIVNTASALIKVSPSKWVRTPLATATVTRILI